MQAGESGGSEPHMFECSDGKRYLVKASNNPQGGRVLVNEVIGGLCLEWLGINHPCIAVVELDPALLAASPGAKFGNGTPLAAGKGFGSEYVQSEPQGTVPPDRIRNLADVGGVVVMDTWVQNTDSRQYRLQHLGGQAPDYRFIPLDQGHSISHSWTAADLRTLAANIVVASPIAPVSGAHCEPFILRLRNFDRSTADHIVSQVPNEWISDDERAALIDYLLVRAHASEARLSQTYGIL